MQGDKKANGATSAAAQPTGMSRGEIEAMAARYGVSAGDVSTAFDDDPALWDRDAFLAFSEETRSRLKGRPQADSVEMVRELRGEL